MTLLFEIHLKRYSAGFSVNGFSFIVDINLVGWNPDWENTVEFRDNSNWNCLAFPWNTLIRSSISRTPRKFYPFPQEVRKFAQVSTVGTFI